MARPLQTGLNYFPLDLTFDQDDKIALIEADFGLEGFAVTVKLLMKIYAESYFYHWGEKEQKLFARRVGVDVSTVIAIVNAALRWGLFSQRLFDDFGILTSRGIQKRYVEAVGRRKDVPVVKEYVLLDERELEKYTNLHIDSLYPEKLPDTADVTAVSDSVELMSTLIPQSKGKESRVKDNKSSSPESKEEPSEPDDDVMTLLDSYKLKIETPTKHVEKQLQNWLSCFDAAVIEEAIDRTGQNGKGYSYLAAILSDFHRKGVRAVTDLAAYDQSFKQRMQHFSKPASSTSVKPSVKTESLPDWAQPDYVFKDQPIDDEADRELKDRLAQIRSRKRD